MSDLHRDVTTRRCLTSYKQVENIVIDCASLTDEIEQTDQLMRERKELFHKMWEEEQQRITTEQTIFKAQVQGPLNHHRSFLQKSDSLSYPCMYILQITFTDLPPKASHFSPS